VRFIYSYTLMIRNFITITVRTFLRQKLYSLINVVGLASGLMCVLLIYLWVTDELSKDKFHKDGKKIYRIVSNLELNDGEILTWTIAPGPLGDDIRDNHREIELTARSSFAEQMLLEYEGEKFTERGYYADPEFFEMFTFKVLHGTTFKKRDDVSSIILSDKLAQKIFGSNEKAIGKSLVVNGSHNLNVVGIYEHPSSMSTMQFSYVIPYEIYRKNRGDGFNWGNYDHPLYVKLNPSDVTNVTQKINERARARSDGDDGNVNFYLQPFEDVYLHGNFENGIPVGGRIEYIRIFTVVGIFMLVIACINFTNMATARAAFRAKEVGIRKVVGAYRRSIISQFMVESVFVSLLSMIFAIGLVYMLLPGFNTLVSKTITLDFTDLRLILAVVGIVLITGIMAGSYPALFLSSYQPAQVLKGTLAKSFSGSSLRKLLVVFQFTLTVILIASSIVIYSQIEYIRNKNIGYDRESILWFPASGNVQRQFDAFKNEVLQIQGISKIGKSNESLVQVNNQNSSVAWPGQQDGYSPFFRTVVADYGYLETMGLKLVEGRFFSPENNDTNNFVLTKKSIEVMGIENPIGLTISQWGFSGTVVGIVEDFHSRSLQEALDPVVFFCKPEWTGRVFVRFESDKTEDAIAALHRVYKKYSNDFPFQYSFLDDDFEKMYNTEKVTGTLAMGFTTMAVIISGLGLLGLAAYTAERRKKEISIRKTLGASVTGIVTMISSDFVKLCLIAAMIGCPIAYYLMTEFLSGYAFHTSLDWKIFVSTAVSVTVICIITVIFQVVRAAIANPVDALRNE
jgi:putative ABC transport system permease protein